MIVTSKSARLYAVVSMQPAGDGYEPKIHIGFSSRREAERHVSRVLAKWHPELARLVDSVDVHEKLPQIWWSASAKQHRVTRYMGVCEDCGLPVFRTDGEEREEGLKPEHYAASVYRDTNPPTPLHATEYLCARCLQESQG